MSKQKNKDEFKERDEIEEYFSEVKNRSFPIGIIFVFILLLIIGGLSYYYSVIDSPKNIFLTVLNNLKIDIELKEKINYEINLDTNIETTNKKYIDTMNILNNIAVKGQGEIDLTVSKIYTKLDTYYKGETMVSLEGYSKLDKSIYIKSDELFDKIIKIDMPNSNNENINKEYNIKKDNLEILANSSIDILRPLLNNAEYKKEYTNLDNSLVKKVSITIDKQFKENLYQGMLSNNEFLNSLSKLEGISRNELEKSIQKLIYELDNDIDSITLYVSILDNKFIKLEIQESDEKFVLTKENNNYSYKIYDEEIIEYQGTIELNKVNNDYDISISHKDVEKDLNININLELTFEYDKEINELDIKNTINYKELTENDINKINDNINKSNNIKTLIDDVIMITSEKEETTE